MQSPWAVVIALAILGFAYLIKHFFLEIVEDEHAFLLIIGIFFVSYVAAAIAVNSLNPLQFLPNAFSDSSSFDDVVQQP